MVGWPQRTVLERVLDSESVAFPKQLIECGSIDFTKSLVAASDHLAMLPEHCVAADLREGTIKSLAITVPGLKRDIAVIFRERSPARQRESGVDHADRSLRHRTFRHTQISARVRHLFLLLTLSSDCC